MACVCFWAYAQILGRRHQRRWCQREVSHGIDVFTVKEPYADQNKGSCFFHPRNQRRSLIACGCRNVRALLSKQREGVSGAVWLTRQRHWLDVAYLRLLGVQPKLLLTDDIIRLLSVHSGQLVTGASWRGHFCSGRWVIHVNEAEISRVSHWPKGNKTHPRFQAVGFHVLRQPTSEKSWQHHLLSWVTALCKISPLLPEMSRSPRSRQ